MTGNKSEHHCCLGGMRVCKTWARAYHFISKNGTSPLIFQKSGDKKIIILTKGRIFDSALISKHDPICVPGGGAGAEGRRRRGGQIGPETTGKERTGKLVQAAY